MPPSNANVRVELNRETGAVRLYARKTVERWPTDEATEISIEEAQAIQPQLSAGRYRRGRGHAG